MSEKKLAAYRKREGMSLQDLSAITGFTAAHLSFVERGKRNLSVRGKLLLARRLGVPIRRLFDIQHAR